MLDDGSFTRLHSADGYDGLESSRSLCSVWSKTLPMSGALGYSSVCGFSPLAWPSLKFGGLRVVGFLTWPLASNGSIPNMQDGSPESSGGETDSIS